MSLLSGIGKRIPMTRFKTAEGLATAGAGIIAMAGIAGFASAHPMKPSVDAMEEIYLGDPDALTKYARASFSTHLGDAFEGDNAQARIDALRQPLRRPRDFSPSGAIVMGMYNSRHG